MKGHFWHSLHSRAIMARASVAPSYFFTLQQRELEAGPQIEGLRWSLDEWESARTDFNIRDVQ